MWVLLSIVMALGLFGLLSLTHMEQEKNATFQVAQSVMETQSAQQMDSFTTAAWAYVTANSVSTGARISVAQLVSAGYLPAAFTASNPFGQTLVALTGTNTLAAYYQNPPNTLYGVPVIPRTEKGVAMKMAEKLSAMQENAPEYVAAISYNGGTGALLPYAATALTMSTNDPQFSTAFPSLLDLVNVLPATSEAGASTPGDSSTGTGGSGASTSGDSNGETVPMSGDSNGETAPMSGDNNGETAPMSGYSNGGTGGSGVSTPVGNSAAW